MGQVAVKSVYTKGDEWVNELVEYITGNMNYMRDFVKENFPKRSFQILEEPILPGLIFQDMVLQMHRS